MFTIKRVTFVLCAAALLTGISNAQQTTTRTNRNGDTVTDTRSLQNGQYTNDKTVTAPNGKTHTNDSTANRNSNGRLVTSDTRTRSNGRSVTSSTTHRANSNRTTVTGPNGHSRTFLRRKR